MTQNLNLSKLGRYSNTAGQLASSGISGGLPVINGGTGNPSLNVTAGGVIYGSINNTMEGNGGGGTSGSALVYTGSAPVWGTGTQTGMDLLKTTFMTGSSQTVTPSGASMGAYRTIYLFINNVTGGGNGNMSLGSTQLFPAMSGGGGANGLYGGFMISNTQGYIAGSIGRNFSGEYFFGASNSSPIAIGLGLPFTGGNGVGLWTGGTVYCYGQK